MKTFVEIRAETPCVLERFLVENANAVEAGQALVSLRTC
jgi:biotin carboxyl carrier protein